MKAKNLFSIVIVFLLICSSTNYARENSSYQAAVDDLQDQIQLELRKVPMNDLYDYYSQNRIVIKLTIDNAGNMNNVVVEGHNQDLVDLTRKILNEANLNISSQLCGHRYSMRFSFTDGTRPIY